MWFWFVLELGSHTEVEQGSTVEKRCISCAGPSREHEKTNSFPASWPTGKYGQFLRVHNRFSVEEVSAQVAWRYLRSWWRAEAVHCNWHWKYGRTTRWNTQVSAGLDYVVIERPMALRLLTTLVVIWKPNVSNNLLHQGIRFYFFGSRNGNFIVCICYSM